MTKDDFITTVASLHLMLDGGVRGQEPEDRAKDALHSLHAAERAVGDILRLRPEPIPVQRKRAQETGFFQEAWAAYPARPNNPRGVAWRAWKARMNEGITENALLAGVLRYVDYTRARGISGEFIMQAATFFGPDRRWEDQFAVVDGEAEFRRRLDQELE